MSISGMNAFLLDDNNELVIQNNSFQPVSGVQAIAQHLQIRFQFTLGEWIYDASLGMPWVQDILTKAPLFTVVNELIRQCILDTPGVIQIISLSLSALQGRGLSITGQAQTTSGVMDFSNVVAIPIVGGNQI